MPRGDRTLRRRSWAVLRWLSPVLWFLLGGTALHVLASEWRTRAETWFVPAVLLVAFALVERIFSSCVILRDERVIIRNPLGDVSVPYANVVRIHTTGGGNYTLVTTGGAEYLATAYGGSLIDVLFKTTDRAVDVSWEEIAARRPKQRAAGTVRKRMVRPCWLADIAMVVALILACAAVLVASLG
ncbi:hypothetical protein ACWDR5_22105 [Streptomyces koyangensis]